MEINSLKECLALIASALSIAKQSKDLLPEGKEKREAESKLNEAEQQHKFAKEQMIELNNAKIAKELGYPLCLCSDTPQKMLFTGNKYHYKCPACGNEIDRTPVPPPAPKFVSFDRPRNYLDFLDPNQC